MTDGEELGRRLRERDRSAAAPALNLIETRTPEARAQTVALLAAGVARVYTPKDFEISRIMGDIVRLVAERHNVAAAA